MAGREAGSPNGPADCTIAVSGPASPGRRKRELPTVISSLPGANSEIAADQKDQTPKHALEYLWFLFILTEGRRKQEPQRPFLACLSLKNGCILGIIWAQGVAGERLRINDGDIFIWLLVALLSALPCQSGGFLRQPAREE